MKFARHCWFDGWRLQLKRIEGPSHLVKCCWPRISHVTLGLMALTYRRTLSVGSLHVVLSHGQVDGGVWRSHSDGLLAVDLVRHHVVTLEQCPDSWAGEDLPHLVHVVPLLPAGHLQVVESRQPVLQFLAGVTRWVPAAGGQWRSEVSLHPSPERSVRVCADLIVEVEESVQLVVLQDVGEEVRVLVLGLSQTVDVVQAVQHQTHRGVGDLVLAHVIAITTEGRQCDNVDKCWEN